MDGTKYDLTPDAWAMVAFNASAALVVPQVGSRIWGQVAPEDEPPDAGEFAIRGMRLIRGIAPFEALWLRADTAPTTGRRATGHREITSECRKRPAAR